jgi:hypothetical protein
MRGAILHSPIRHHGMMLSQAQGHVYLYVGDDSTRGVLGCDAVCSCGRILLRGTIRLPPHTYHWLPERSPPASAAPLQSKPNLCPFLPLDRNWRRHVHASRNVIWDATRFRPGPYPVQYVYKRYSPNPRGPSSPLCRWYTHKTDRIEGYVLRKLQCDLTSIESWCQRWNIKINEDKIQTI